MVKTMIGLFAGQDQRNYDEKWPEIMLVVNTSVSEPTGYLDGVLARYLWVILRVSLEGILGWCPWWAFLCLE